MNTTFYRVGRLRNGTPLECIDVDYLLDAVEQIDDWIDERLLEIAHEAPKGYNANYTRVPESEWSEEWVAHAKRIERLGDAEKRFWDLASERRFWDETWEGERHESLPDADHVFTADTDVFWIEEKEELERAS